MSFFKKLFGKEDDFTDELLAQMMDGVEKWRVYGAKLAEDSLINGMRKGQMVKMTDMEALIRENYDYNTEVVINGFVTQMLEYVNSEEVLSFIFEDDERVFIHKDYVNDFF